MLLHEGKCSNGEEGTQATDNSRNHAMHCWMLPYGEHANLNNLLLIHFRAQY